MILDSLKRVLPKPVKQGLKRIISPYWQWQYVRCTERLISRADTSRPAEVAVFTMIAENWNSFESLYRVIEADSRMNITVYVFPGKVFTDRPK